MAGNQSSSVALVAVDENVLLQLVHAATTDAVADDVTPPWTTGGSWTPARVEWLREFHRVRRAGLSGPAGEVSWAVALDAQVVGSVRLKRTDEPGLLEAGIWLTRGARGRGVGRAAMAAALREAAALGAGAVRADTTAANVGALAVLRHLGFTLTSADNGHDVHAVVRFGPEASRGGLPGTHQPAR